LSRFAVWQKCTNVSDEPFSINLPHDRGIRFLWNVGTLLPNYTTNVHAMKTYRGRKGIAPLILKLGARWRWEINGTPSPLYPGKERRNPLNKRRGGPLSRPGGFGEEKNLLPPPGIKPRFVQSLA
jgi:hypothetical protein